MRHAALAAAAVVALAGCDNGELVLSQRQAAPVDVCTEVRTLALSAQRDSFSFNFAEAERKFARLLGRYENEDVASVCPRVPTLAFLYASQGLALSNQEEFRLAQAAFDRAQAALDAQTVPPQDEVLLLESFRVQDALNRGLVEETDAAFAKLSRVLRDADVNVGADVGGDTLFAPDDASLRQLIGYASSEYVRSISLSTPSGGERPGAARLAEAERAIDTAIDVIGTVPSASAAYLSRFQIQKAAILLERGEAERARLNAARAAESLQALLPGTPLAARALLIRAKAETEAGQRAAALATYDAAFDIYEENPVPIRASNIWGFFKLALEERRRTPSLAPVLNAQMFRAAQLVRSSVAAKTIAGAAALFAQEDTSAAQAVRDWQEASDRYGLLKAAQVQAQNDPLAPPEAKAALQAEVVDAAAALEAALAARDRIAPDFRATLDAPVTLASVQEVLRPGEALVQVLVSNPRNLVVVVTDTGVDVISTDVSAAQTEEIVTILRSFVEVGPGGQFKNFDAEVANFAYVLLLGEADGLIRGKERLFFSLTGALGSLPMEMLVVDAPDPSEGAAWRGGDYTDVAWLGRASDIGYVPSPRNLVDIRRAAGTSNAPKPIVAFGDFVPGTDTDAFLRRYRLSEKCRRDADYIARLSRLPSTAEEARLVATSLGAPSEVNLGAAFTQQRIDALDLSEYRVLHFATHGLLWPTPDCFSEPALSLSAPAGADADPLLTASDIRGLELDAQLVVLSACETAGPAERGQVGAAADSLSGLARAFFAAGARAVVASHWTVFSEQTTALMTAFYEEIGASDADFATALRAAQERVRSTPETSHPIYWAAFVTIGDGAMTLDGQGGT